MKKEFLVPLVLERKESSFFQKLRARLLLLCCCLLISTVNYAQSQTFTVSMKKASLKEVMDFVSEKSNYFFLYNDEDIKNINQVTIRLENGTIEDLLNQALKNTNITYEISDNTITLKRGIVKKKEDVELENIEMYGRVLDQFGEPLPGVSVFVKGSQNGVSTNISGNYQIKIEGANSKIVVSFVGMKTQEITPKQGRRDIILLEDKMMLDEVVVTGYQTISKERATGSYAVVETAKINEKLQPSVISRLEGQVPGLVSTDGKISIRGIATLRGERAPLFVVDDIPFEGDIETINPANIENITVLKDAAAASIYGARAANGVIVISTKKGAGDGKTSVSYNGSIRFTPKPDFGYLNLMNSRELVDLQKYSFQFETGKYEERNPRVALSPVRELLFKHRSNLITDAELEKGLEKYRNLDNRGQIEDYYLRTGVLQQHNVAISGGSEKSRYFATINYLGNAGNAKYSNDETLSFSLRNNIDFYKWMSADLVISGSFNKENSNFSPNDGAQDAGGEGYYDIYRNYPSYYMLKDESGNPLNIQKDKSEEELERLRSIGLRDETYSPILDRDKQTFLDKENYYRIQLGLNFKITDYLNFDAKYQTEFSSYKNRKLYDKDSFFVRNMVNEAAQYDAAKKELTLNVPNGGQLDETRGDSFSYTLRGQFNFMKDWNDKHYVTAIAGAERRQIKNTFSRSYYMGYDDNSLGFKPINPSVLNPLNGTESIGGSFNWVYTDHNFLRSKEDRFVSFYANTSYTYKQKYNFTSSIRVDESNLFGTDTKNQYKPLWSVGGSWFLGEEEVMQDIKWLDRLNLRATYGIGGNIPKDAGPFLTLNAPQYNDFVNDFGSSINNPPNPKLTWEKTETTNVGIDFSVLNHKLRGSIDYYYKYTSDLLAFRDADPTLGWKKLMLNYGTMTNKGLEVFLQSDFNIGEFKINPSISFSYNKNELIDVDDSGLDILNYTKGNAAVKGYPYASVFSFRFAGLSEKDGTPLYYNKDGEKEAYTTSIENVVYSGTRIPKYSTSLSNSIFYKNFNLSFMFIYNGGHVMRAETSRYSSLAPGSNDTREYLNVWKKPGDEKNPNTTPAFTGAYVYPEDTHQWAAADKHVVKADYIKLRDLSLSYQFDNSWVQRLHIDSFKLSFQIQNLLTWEANDKGLDPEAMTTQGYGWGVRSLPQPTTYTIGVAINF